MNYFSYFFFFWKTGFDISCKLFPLETICMKYQNLFSGKSMKNLINVSSAELAKRVVKVKVYKVCSADDPRLTFDTFMARLNLLVRENV